MGSGGRIPSACPGSRVCPLEGKGHGRSSGRGVWAFPGTWRLREVIVGRIRSCLGHRRPVGCSSLGAEAERGFPYIVSPSGQKIIQVVISFSQSPFWKDLKGRPLTKLTIRQLE